MNFKGKRVLVTGSTAGLGREVAEMFLESGAAVAINGGELESVNLTLRELGNPQAHAALGDVSTVDGCESVLESAVTVLGGLDVLVNSNEICPLSFLMDVTEEHWDTVFNTNLRSAYFCTKFALPALRASRGNIVMVASVAGLIAGPTDGFVYSISKGGMVNLAKALALELATDGIRVNAVCPGYTDTAMAQAENAATKGQLYEFICNTTPLHRVGSLREIASSILFLASDLAAYCTGTLLVNDGGCWAQASRGGATTGRTNPDGPARYVPSEKR